MVHAVNCDGGTLSQRAININVIIQVCLSHECQLDDEHLWLGCLSDARPELCVDPRLFCVLFLVCTGDVLLPAA